MLSENDLVTFLEGAFKAKSELKCSEGPLMYILYNIFYKMYM
jgi:hypothetical protein